MTTSNDYNIQASFNYTDREIDISLSAAGTGIADLDGGNTDIEFIYKVIDSQGKVVQFGRLQRDVTDPLRPVTYSNSSNFGYSRFGLSHTAVGLPGVTFLQGGNTLQVNNKYDYAGGYEPSDADKTGAAWVTHFPLSMWASPYKNPTFPGANKTAEYEQRLAYNNPNVPWSTQDGAYNNDTIIIEDGDAVLKGLVDTVSGNTDITLTTANTKNGTLYSGENIAPAILKVTAGTYAGETYYCSAQSSDTLTLDGDVEHLSGQRVALMPVRTISSYQGYDFNSAIYSGLGFGGPNAKFFVDTAIPKDLGSFTFSGGGGWSDEGTTATGSIDWITIATTPNLGDGNFSTLGSYVDNFQEYASVTGNTFLIENPSRGGATVDFPMIGSVARFRGTDDSYQTGIVTFVDTGSSDVNHPIRIGLYPPTSNADASRDLNIYQPNTFTVLTYPEFDTDYTIEITQGLSKAGKVYLAGDSFTAQLIGLSPAIQNPQSSDASSWAFISTGDIYSNTEVSTTYSKTIRTPSASVDITANEYESQFTTVPETTHFHIGPVHLSNGEVLTEVDLSATKLPALNIALTVKGGDPTALQSYIDSSMYMTQIASGAPFYNGQYSYNGLSTFTTSQVFNASQTLWCEATASYGAANVKKTIALPVQPSV